MSIPVTALSPLATTTLACSICSSTYSKRKELLHHLRISSDEVHTTFRYDSSAPANASILLALGVLPCPLACGALFDGRSTCTSKELDAHIARGSCRARRLGSLPLPREFDTPYLSTITRGVTVALESVASQAHDDPGFAFLISVAILFCQDHLDFTAKHMKTSGAHSAAAMSAHASTMLVC